MDGFTKLVKIDQAKKTLTARAGLQLVDAAAALRKKGLQFMLNIEIGNITLGSAACCQTKDSLDGVEQEPRQRLMVSCSSVAANGSRSKSRQAAINRSNCDGAIGSPGMMPRIRRASSSKSQMNSRPVACLV